MLWVIHTKELYKCMIKRCQCTAHISGDWGPLWSCSKYFSKIQLGKNKVFLMECPKFALFLVKVKNLDFFYNGTKIQLFSFAKSTCSIPGVRATYHTSSWTFITSPIAQKYAYFSPCAACVTFYVNFPTNFHCFSLFFGYIEWNKHSLSPPRRGGVPREW